MRGMNVKVERIETELGIEKRCTKCGEFWPEDSAFYLKHYQGGYYSECRACYCERNQRRYAASKQKQNQIGVRA